MKLIFFEKVNIDEKVLKMVIFGPKCPKNGDFKVIFFFASFSLQRIFFAQKCEEFFLCEESAKYTLE